MKANSILLAMSLLFISSSAFSKTIRCDDMTEADTIGTVVLTYDAKGSLVSLVAQRKADAEYEAPAINLAFTAKNATFKQGLRKNTTDGVDEETGKPIYSWGIEDVEYAEAYSKNGDSIKITLFDHMYSGTAGSTIEYKQSNVVSGAAFMFICK